MKLTFAALLQRFSALILLKLRRTRLSCRLQAAVLCLTASEVVRTPNVFEMWFVGALFISVDHFF